MKVTYNWLKDFVEIKLPAKELADKLTMAGIEVKSVEEKLGDFIFEIEITSNRPDWLSVIGVAREVAAITGKKLKGHKVVKSQVTSKAGQALTIEIENKKDCPLYTATIIKNVKVAPSPTWLKARLESVGCRSINNIVDITNYVLFEYGEPLHAFDLEKLASAKIIIRRAREREKIIAIDEVERVLSPEILVIADQEKPQAIAGVMGGKHSEVSFATKNILLEAAIFDPLLVRRGRQKLGIQTESSYRFERGVDLETAQKARARAIALIQEIAAGTVEAGKSQGLAKTKTPPISLNPDYAERLLGAKIETNKIKSILNYLGFAVKLKKKDSLSVNVPGYRQDVKKEIDLIEEIARIYGYDRIPRTLPRVAPQLSSGTTWELVGLVKNILVGCGLNEVITYSLIERGGLKDFGAGISLPVEIANPLSKEQEILRPTLLLNLTKCAAHNLNQKQELVQIFEIAKAFSLAQNLKAQEELVLAIALCGNKSWILPQGKVSYELGILDLKGIVKTLFTRLGIKDYTFETESNVGAAIFVERIKVGVMNILPREAAERLDIKNKNLALAELNLELILKHAKLEKKFISLPLYPGITRDLSILVKEEVSLSAILSEIKEKAGLILEEVKLSDFYKGKQVPAGFKSLTISCFFRSAQRTLVETEVQPVLSAISQALSEKFSAQFR